MFRQQFQFQLYINPSNYVLQVKRKPFQRLNYYSLSILSYPIYPIQYLKKLIVTSIGQEVYGLLCQNINQMYLRMMNGD